MSESKLTAWLRVPSLNRLSLIVGIVATVGAGLVYLGMFVADAQANDSRHDRGIMELRREDRYQRATLDRVDETSRVTCDIVARMVNEPGLCPRRPSAPEGPR